MNRRHFIAGLPAAGFALTPLAALIAACSGSAWPDGMVEIKWDRDTCARCSMVISDRRYAAELRGGPKNLAFKFDDIGCLAVWLRDKAQDHPWMADPATRLWVADIASPGDAVHWLDARNARYSGGRTSPMGYGFAASTAGDTGALDFAALRQAVYARGR
jgi:hypothetical protein